MVTTINMGSTMMPISGPNPSSTFTSRNMNIFSRDSVALVDGTYRCIGPFSYKFKKDDNLWVIWCPLKQGSINQINITYPLYSNKVGKGFPLSTVFAYSYSASNGQMLGYRLDNQTASSNLNCSVVKITTYDLNTSNPQES